MQEAETIEHNGRKIAVVVRKGLDVGGIKFFTPPEYPLQLGAMVHEAGSEIRPHMHRPADKLIKETHEILRVDSGSVDVDLYDEGGSKLETVRLEEGDTILLVSGGHGLRFPEKAKITEVKQGPYAGNEADKEFL